MKKISYFVATIATMALMGCSGLGTTGTSSGNGSGILGSILGAVTNADALGNVLGSVLGTDKPTEAQLLASWKYKQPGVAFTSDNLLAKAGGEVAASQIKEKLASYYQTVGIKSSNTTMTFNSDYTFSGKIMGKTISGTYTYDPSTGQVVLKTLLFSANAYVKNTTAGLGILFEAKKLLSIMQTLAKLSGNSTLQGIGDLSSNYDGLRIGFDMSK